jgi:hypothetical protein
MSFKYGSPLHRAALAADQAWSAELQRLFGKHAGDVRYHAAGKGDAGTALRRLYDTYVVARDSWSVECQEAPKPTVVDDGMGGEYRAKQITAYQWGKDTSRRPWWRLRPVSSPDWHVLNSIATVYTTKHSRGSDVHASYQWHSTGNKPYANGVFKSVVSAKRWVESELAKFWEPPEVMR